VLEWTGARARSRAVVTRLGQVVHDQAVEPCELLDLGRRPVGGYAVRLVSADGTGVARTAFDVLTSPVVRPRYGFLSEFGPGRTAEETDAAGVLCLAFPLRPPGRPDAPSRLPELNAVRVPVLVVQGRSDPFGMPRGSKARKVVRVDGDHGLKSDRAAVEAAVRDWLVSVTPP